MRVNISRATSDEVPMTILSSYTKRAEILTVSVGVEQVNDGFSYTSVGIVNDGGHLNISDVLKILDDNGISVSAEELMSIKEHYHLHTRDELLNAMIRSRYSVEDELTLLRYRDDYPDEYEAYELAVKEMEEKIGTISEFSVSRRPSHYVSRKSIIDDLRRLMASKVDELTDEEAAEVPSLYPTYKEMVGKTVEAGKRLWDDGKLYRVVQTHVASEEWYPSLVPALFAEVKGIRQDEEGEEVQTIDEWEQPLSTNPYMRGEKCLHNGKKWESLVDNNIWEPGMIGTESLWKEVQ